jgi:hypothetical protein
MRRLGGPDTVELEVHLLTCEYCQRAVERDAADIAVIKQAITVLPRRFGD